MASALKKSILGLFTTAMMLAFLEVGARAFSAIKHHNANTWTYGKTF